MIHVCFSDLFIPKVLFNIWWNNISHNIMVIINTNGGCNIMIITPVVAYVLVLVPRSLSFGVVFVVYTYLYNLTTYTYRTILV